MTEKKKASSAVYSINYHIVWCTKYRQKVLGSQVSKTAETILTTICDTKSWEILELVVMEDHIHLFLSASPFESPTAIVKILKGVSAKQLFAQHPELRNALWKGTLCLRAIMSVLRERSQQRLFSGISKTSKHRMGDAIPPPVKTGGLLAPTL